MNKITVGVGVIALMVGLLVGGLILRGQMVEARGNYQETNANYLPKTTCNSGSCPMANGGSCPNARNGNCPAANGGTCAGAKGGHCGCGR